MSVHSSSWSLSGRIKGAKVSKHKVVQSSDLDKKVPSEGHVGVRRGGEGKEEL